MSTKSMRGHNRRCGHFFFFFGQKKRNQYCFIVGLAQYMVIIYQKYGNGIGLLKLEEHTVKQINSLISVTNHSVCFPHKSILYAKTFLTCLLKMSSISFTIAWARQLEIRARPIPKNFVLSEPETLSTQYNIVNSIF